MAKGVALAQAERRRAQRKAARLRTLTAAERRHEEALEVAEAEANMARLRVDVEAWAKARKAAGR